jgi:hypothetical protein
MTLLAERLLCDFREIAGEAAAVDLGSLANRLDQRDESGAQLVEERADRGDGHAVFGQVDERVVRMLVAGVVRSELAAHFHGLFEHRPHGREIVRRPRLLPGVIRGGHVRRQPLDE